eukprot:748511-Hanusia_phi.AAC.3
MMVPHPIPQYRSPLPTLVSTFKSLFPGSPNPPLLEASRCLHSRCFFLLPPLHRFTQSMLYPYPPPGASATALLNSS